MAKILVADDDMVQCDFIAHMLKSCGHTVIKAHSGISSFKMAKSYAPDIALIDLHMEENNIGMVYGIRIKEQLNIPVVIMSASADMETIRNVARIRPSTFLPKPFFEDQINAVVMIALKHASSIPDEIRMRELVKRVNNNLVSLFGFIYVNADENGLDAGMVSSLKSQILAMGRVSSHLSPDHVRDGGIDAKNYFERLIADVSGSFRGDDVANVLVHVEWMYARAPVLYGIGLFIHECLVNCFKHAFDVGNKNANRIEVKFSHHDGWNILSIADNGVGLSGLFDIQCSHGFGFYLLNTIAKSLHGILSISGKNGVTVTLKIPAQEMSAIEPDKHP